MTNNFFIVTDVHLGGGDAGSEDFAISLKNMKKINQQAPLIIPGDLTTFSDAVWFKEAHRLLKETPFSPTLLTLGNHDVRGRKSGLADKPDEKQWLDRWKRVWQEDDTLEDPRFSVYHEILPIYQEMIQDLGETTTNKPYLHEEINGLHFFTLCTERPLKDMCYLSKEQLNWLKEELTTIRKNDATSPIFIFSHQPLNNTFPGSELYGGFGEENDALVALLSEFEHIIFCSGHVHNGLGIADILPLSFGYGVDLTSYCRPDNGKNIKSAGYYVTVTDEKILFEPYFLGDLMDSSYYPLEGYEKEIIL